MPLETSPALRTRTECVVSRNVPMPMRDGTVLYADIYRPQAGGKYPALMTRLPYDKSNSMVAIFHAGLEPLRAVAAGYAVVIQDTRGSNTSDGRFMAFENEACDGYDSVEWVATQPWCNGKVGMYGGSYFGATQLLAATAKPPSLRAIVPLETGSNYYEGWAYQGGAFQLGFNLFWLLSALAPSEVLRRKRAGQDVQALDEALQALMNDPWAALRHLPLGGHDVLAELVPSWADWLAHPALDNFWKATAIDEHYQDIATPALHIGGWYDLFLKGTLQNYAGLRDHAATNAAQRGQSLLVGPWAHAVPYDSIGEVEFGPGASQAALDMTALHLSWFERHLVAPKATVDLPRVRLFVMGRNHWRDEADWPLSRARPTKFYFHPVRADQPHDGTLSTMPPEASEAANVYIYDPHDPVPTCGGATFLPGLFVGMHTGPRDQRTVERRADVLVYTSDPLRTDLEVTGPLSVVLHAATSAVDTDWTAKLVDVHPDGRALIVSDGILRARFREGFHQPKLLEPGRVYRYTIDLVATSIVFLAGHRVRVEISSSNFPRFDRNPNNGRIGAEVTEADFIPARQTVFHDAEHPSYILLPVVEGSS